MAKDQPIESTNRVTPNRADVLKSLQIILAEEKPANMLILSHGVSDQVAVVAMSENPDMDIRIIEADKSIDFIESGTKKGANQFHGVGCPINEVAEFHELKGGVMPIDTKDYKSMANKYGKRDQDLISKASKGIERFDFVYLDTCGASSKYELEKIHGAKIIFLYGTRIDINRLNYERLASGGTYWCIETNKTGYGFAIFKHL